MSLSLRIILMQSLTLQKRSTPFSKTIILRRNSYLGEVRNDFEED